MNRHTPLFHTPTIPYCTLQPQGATLFVLACLFFFQQQRRLYPGFVAFMFLLWVLSERSERYFDLRGKLEYTYFAGDFGIYRFVDVCKMGWDLQFQ